MATRPLDPGGQARAALHSIAKDYGAAALSHPEFLNNLLRDMIPDSPREASALVAAADANVAGILQERAAQRVSTAAAVAQAAATLEEQTALAQDACQWVARQLAEALGLQLQASADTGPAPATNAGHTPAAGPILGAGSSSPTLRFLTQIKQLKRARAMAFSPDSARLAIACLGNLGVVIDRAGKWQLRVRHGGLAVSVRDVAFNPAGHRFATAGYNTARIWDVASGRQVFQVTHHSVRGVTFSPAAATFATWGGDRTARIWDATTGEQVGCVVEARAVEGMAFSRDGHRFATGTGRSVQIWDTATGEQRLKLTQSARVEDVAFSPDGRCVATAEGIWDTTTGERRFFQLAPGDHVNEIEFSPDGRWIATAGGLGPAQIWDVASGRRLLQITQRLPDYDVAYGASFSPDGKLIAVIVNHDRVDLWEVTENNDQEIQ